MRKNNTEFQKKKNVILFIYGYSCQICGLIDTSNHVHHIDKNNGNNNSINLLPLCDHCHKLVHKGFFIYVRDPDKNIRHELDKLEAYF
jgi:5-methylcytosine-specific restriction endonuclease McrA